MAALPYRRIVLFDVNSNQPLVFYDCAGGLEAGTAEKARKHFTFLHTDHDFTLHTSTYLKSAMSEGALAEESDNL